MTCARCGEDKPLVKTYPAGSHCIIVMTPFDDDVHANKKPIGTVLGTCFDCFMKMNDAEWMDIRGLFG